MLGHIGDRAAVLPTQAESLDHAQHEQDDRGQETDRGVGRDDPDERGRQSHPGERHEEGVFAANPVADRAEHQCAERPDQEPHREEGHGAEQRRDRMALLEELDREDRGQAPEHVEVVPLDHVADRGREHDPTKLRGG